MPHKNPGNFANDRARASAAGKKSRRGSTKNKPAM